MRKVAVVMGDRSSMPSGDPAWKPEVCDAKSGGYRLGCVVSNPAGMRTSWARTPLRMKRRRAPSVGALVAFRQFIARQRRQVGHAGENAVELGEVCPFRAGGDVVAHLPCGNLRGKGQRHDLIHGDVFFFRGLVSEAGEVI